MENLLQRINRSLPAKLIITIALLLVVGVAISCLTLIVNGRNTLMRYTVDHIASSSELVKRSIHYGMLTFDRESIPRIIDSISSKEDILGIRIFDSRGEIFFSSSAEEIGRLVDRSSFACTGCHSDPEKPSATLTADKQWVTYEDRHGNDILTFVDPIFNDVSCATADCHVHPREQRYSVSWRVTSPWLPSTRWSAARSWTPWSLPCSSWSSSLSCSTMFSAGLSSIPSRSWPVPCAGSTGAS